MQADQNIQGEDGGEGPQSVFSAMMKEFNNMREKEKMEDEEAYFSPFAGMEKSSVLQEAKAAFNDSKEVKYEPQKCALLITKLIYLLVIGETFSDNDTTDVFFSVTKLFQSNNINLRRMTYLFLKEFAESTESDNIIIVISSLTKDINNSDIKLYRANAIRVLCKIIDTHMLNQIERYIKQSVVDKSSLIASCALISANQLVRDKENGKGNKEIIKRWVNEISEAANSGSEMVQFHALQLLYELRKSDKLAVSRMITNYIKSVKSPMGMVLLIRWVIKLLNDDMQSFDPKMAYDYLSQCLRNKNEMVIYEAARAMCKLPNLTPNDLLPALSVLNLFLNSSKSSVKFAAVRTLNDLATVHGAKIADIILSKSQEALENLVTDPNRSISTLALTTLLKIGNENTVEKLIKQVGTFISEISDEFKIVIVKAVHTLCLKYKSKAAALLSFLSTLLREEGGFEFKKVVVDSLLDLMEAMPETKETCLFHLCEFIEDCEFTLLSSKVLFYLGEHGPGCKNASKFVRYIYNRIILENAQIRAASVSALGKFGAKCESLRGNVVKLLRESLHDEDDEVRDRATFCLRLLERNTVKSNEVLINHEVSFVNPTLLQKQLEIFESMNANMNQILSFDILPHVEDFDAAEEKYDDAFKTEAGPTSLSTFAAENTGVPTQPQSKESYAEKLFQVEAFQSYGNLFKTVRPKQLTESETEYLVTVIKHVFKSVIVFQFNITNTLNDQILVDVSVAMEETEGANEWEVDQVIPAGMIKYGTTETAFVSFRLPEEAGGGEDLSTHHATFMNELRFKVQQIDESDPEEIERLTYEEVKELVEESSSPEEEYVIEDLPLKVSDFVNKLSTPVTNFRNAWGDIDQGNEVIDKFQLTQYKSLKEAVKAVVEELGMDPCEGTGLVQGTETHTMFLAGRYLTGETILARAQFNFDQGDKATVLKVAIRAEDAAIARAVISCI